MASPDSRAGAPWSQLGGRWSIALPPFLITAALAFMGFFVEHELAHETPRAVALWCGVGLGTVLVVGCELFVMHRTLFRNRATSPIPAAWVMVHNAFVGVLYGGTMYFGAALLDLPNRMSLPETLVLNGVTAMWWGAVITFYFVIRDEDRAARGEAVAAAAELSMLDQKRQRVIAQLAAQVHAQVSDGLREPRARVAAALDRLKAADTGTAPVPEQWSTASTLLRDAAERSVRPLSQRLSTARKQILPRTPWWTIIANIVREQPFRPLAIICFDIVGAAPAQIEQFGYARAIPLVLAVNLLVLAVSVIANSAMRRVPRHHRLIFILGIACMQLAVPLRWHFRELWEPGSAGGPWAIGQLIAGVITILVTSAFGAVRDLRHQMQGNYRSELQAEVVEEMALNQQLALIAEESARVLHGSIQTRLVACAMQIDQASKRLDSAQLDAALEQALRVLSTPLPMQRSSSDGLQRGISEEVQRKVSLWTGLCDFDVDLDALAEHAHLATTVGRIVEEGITNAIRHGRATHIAIDVRVLDPETLQVSVTDNGSGGPLPPHPAGMGTAMIAQASRGQWSLTSSAAGTELEVRLAV